MKVNHFFAKTFILIITAGLFITGRHQIVQAQSFTTTFAVIGDYGLAGPNEADVANLVKSWNPAFIVTLGDNNYPNGSIDSIDQNIGQYYHDYIYPYKGKYGSGSATKRFFPSLGNHDWGPGTPNVYYNYFSFFNQRGYYDFVQGSVHFYMLDSDPKEPDGTSSTSTQAKWLRSALGGSTSSFNVVTLHHAPYSSGAHGSNAYMQWPYKEWGADVVLAGHDHIYERLLVNNLPYFVNGIGGAELYQYGSILPESQVRFNSDFGAMRVEATDITMKFQMYTRTGVLVDQYTLGQTTPTVLSITRIGTSPTNSVTVEYAINFSEAVTGVDVSDFQLVNTTINDAFISSVSGSGASYSVTINTGSGSGAVQLSLSDDDSIIGSTLTLLGGTGIGNGNFQSNDVYTVDKTVPAVVGIALANPNPTNAPSVDYYVSFSEPVSGVDGSDFILFSSSPSGAFVSNVTGAGNNYTVSVNTGNGDTTLRLDMIDNHTITDAVGNFPAGSFTAGQTYTIHKNTPTVTSLIRSGAATTNSSSVDFILTFSEPVSGVDASDFSLASSGINNAFISNIVNSNPFYIVTVSTGTGDGIVDLDILDDDTIVNAIGTNLGGSGIGNGSYSSGETYTIDKTSPTATSIQRASTNPTASSSVDFIVTFSEQVSGVDAADFIPTTTNINNAFISNIVNVNPFYIVSVNTGTGTGSLRLNLADNDSIMDVAGNPLGGIGTGNGNFVSGDSFDVSKEAVNFPSPTLLEPRRNLLTNNSTPAFSWTLVRNARGYEILIALDENFSQVILDQTVSKTTFVPSTPIQDGVLYWKVRAFNPDLLPGKYSPAQILLIDKTPPAAPQPASPINNSPTLKRPWLQWIAAADAIQFQIEVDNNPNFLKPEFRSTSNKLFVRAEGLSKGTWFWRVKARDSAGNWSEWSPAATFWVQ
jgi:hypothetical protein